MAGQTISSVMVGAVGATPVQIIPPVPAGKAESVCLMASINGGVAPPDHAISVILTDPVVAPGGQPIIFNEPVRFRKPGGSPVLLVDFIVPAGASLSVVETTGGANGLVVVAFNRWRFDAVVGQNMPLALVQAVGTAQGVIANAPAGKAESLCIMACLAPGSTADGYIDLILSDGVTPLVAVFAEPVRYRIPGGSPVLLQNYILSPGLSLIYRGVAGQTVNLLVHNRWRFDA